jgi:excinuclease ABC subunit C
MESVTFDHRLALTPESPGVYLMRDSSGEVLYVGKASSLKSRIGYYFGPTRNLPAKIQTMVSRIADYEFIVTDSPSEALILENRLIKNHKPPYNARLKDDKTYPYLKIDLTEDFPQVYITRRIAKDGAKYFGPFATASSIRKSLGLLKKLFPYRSCTKVINGNDSKPCLEYHISRCCGPCIGAVTKEEYHKVVQQVVLFMEGKTDVVTKALNSKMEEASGKLEFERAAIIRDQIRNVQRTSEEQRVLVEATSAQDLDVIGTSSADDETWVEVFFIRHGRLIGRDHFSMEGTQGYTAGHTISEFVKQFYQAAPFVPPLIVLQHLPKEQEFLEHWLKEQRGGKVTFVCPKRGRYQKLLQMVTANASHGLSQKRAKWLTNADATLKAMIELEEELNLPQRPRRIECFDISNTQGTNSVGSMVVFEHGIPKPSHYRRFRIKHVKGPDDYASMQEVLLRRFKRLGSSNSSGVIHPSRVPPTPSSNNWGIVPDLVLIDGGKGHLSAALEVFLHLGLDFIALASLAKENEVLHIPHTPEPISLPRNSQGLYLVQRIRDEAHRFAINYHRSLRSKKTTNSAMDFITGIGPQRKKTLIRRFGSLQGIKQAALEDLTTVPGITRSLAIRIKEVL